VTQDPAEPIMARQASPVDVPRAWPAGPPRTDRL